MIAEIGRAIERYSLGDQLVAIERTGIYHLPVKRVFVSNKFDTMIVHPLMQAATDHIPKSEHAPEAKSLDEELQPSTRRQPCGPRRLGEILPVVLAKLGVNAVDLSLN